MGEGRGDEGMNGRAKDRGPSWRPAWRRRYHRCSRIWAPPVLILTSLLAHWSGRHLARARGGQSDRYKSSLSQGGKR